MGIRMIRKPSADYIVRAGTNYYAPDDTELTESLGTLTEDYPASMFNLDYGKISMEFLVSTQDMVMQSTEGAYNTVSNIDDIIPFRYAYINQNGYVADKGMELEAEAIGSTLKINSGRVVLQGVESDIDASGISFEVDNISGIMYYTIYYHVDLANNRTSIEIRSDATAFPIMTGGDNLTNNPIGVANLDLYHLYVENGVIQTIAKVVEKIEYGGMAGKAIEGYDFSKGTIEERLTSLGFKQGNIIDGGGNVVGVIKRQGNFVTGVLNIANKQIQPNSLGLAESYYLDVGNYNKKDFLPKSTIFLIDVTYFTDTEKRFWCAIRDDETLPIVFGNTFDYTMTVNSDVTFGYETNWQE